MKNLKQVLCLFIVVSVSAVSWAHAQDDTGRIKQVFPWDRAVQFQQVIFDFDTGSTAESDWGQIQVFPKKLRRILKECSGYINVFVNADGRNGLHWVVENLLVPEPDEQACTFEDVLELRTALSMDPFGQRGELIRALYRRDRVPVTTYLDLGPGGESSSVVDELAAVVVLCSRQPLPIRDDILTFVGERFSAFDFPVELTVVNAEGDTSGADEVSSTVTNAVVNGPLVLGPPPPPVVIPSIPSLDLSFPLVVKQNGNPNTNAARNQCVPMSHANALAYLKNRYNELPLRWYLDEIGTRGLGMQTLAGDVIIWEPVPDYSIVANVDTFTRRVGTFNVNVGGGSSRCRNIRGLLGYLAAFGDEAVVVMRHQGGASVYGDGATCGDTPIDLGGLTSTREGEEVTWQWIFDQLVQGRSVVMSFSRYDLAGAWASGHMLRVRGAARYNNREYLMTMDDSSQGNNTSGIRWQTWEVFDKGQPTSANMPNGRLELSGTNWEIIFALSMEAKPTLLIP